MGAEGDCHENQEGAQYKEDGMDMNKIKDTGGKGLGIHVGTERHRASDAGVRYRYNNDCWCP